MMGEPVRRQDRLFYEFDLEDMVSGDYLLRRIDAVLDLSCHVEGMSIREAARVFGLHRETVSKMLRFSVPPGYRRSGPVRRPKLDAFTGVIDRIFEG